MKKILMFLFCLYSLLNLFTGCTKWTDQEALVVQSLDADSNSLGPNYKKYLEKLRAYKQSAHPQAIGLFNTKNWKTDATQQSTFLYSLPDSLDMICLLNQDSIITSEQKADMSATQATKGTKMLMSFDLIRMNDRLKSRLPASPSKDEVTTSINAYVDSMLNIYQQNKYNGIYIRYEDLYCFNCNEILSDIDLVSSLISRIAAANFSKKILFQFKGTDAVYLKDEAAASIDYFVLNSLNVKSTSYYEYDGFLEFFTKIKDFNPSKFILLASFEGDRWKMGGDEFPVGNSTFIGTSEALARWNVAGGKKGGLGIYYIEQDYKNNPPFKYSRNAVQILNPSIK